MAEDSQIEAFREYIEGKGLPFFVISAATTSGTAELMNFTYKTLKDLPPLKVFEPDPEPLWSDADSSEAKFEITVEDGVYFVEADWLEGILRTANMEDYESLQHFQLVLRSSGIIDELERLGIEEGDTVSVGGYEFDYVR